MKQLTLALALLATPTAAFAWEENDDKQTCGFSQVFEDETFLYIHQDKAAFDRQYVIFALANDAWSIKEDQKIDDTFYLTDDQDDMTSEANVIAFEDHGVMSRVSEKSFEPFISVLIRGVTVHVGNKKLLAANWAGFWDAYQKFDACRKEKGWSAERQARLDEEARIAKEKRYRQSVPLDPFATPPPKTKIYRRVPNT